MGIEIERKFLVKNDNWRSTSRGVFYQQGYLLPERDRIVRIRVAGKKGFITIKGRAKGLSRSEFEYPMLVNEARTLLNDLCEKPLIEKIRYKIEYNGLIWEVDEFSGENDGLVLAEVELPSETHIIEKPDWVGKEVTGQVKYYNSNLVSHPFSKW